jgi:cytochrome c556
VVLIKGDNAEGTGFLIKTADGPVVMTNIHVISNNPNIKITTNTGAPITILSYKGATDRDMAMIAIKDGKYSYLDLATDVSGTVEPGDEVITPGNSEGGEVMLNTDGKVLGIGPDRVEFDNPIYHGNSGGPVIHVKSGKVIGIVTEGVKVDVSDELDKSSFANRNSAIAHSMRYFGFRVDTVPGWEPYDWDRFQNETAFLDQFDQRNRCLDSFLNAPDDGKPEDTLWEEDAKIVKADNGYFDQASGDADASQQMDADRVVWAEISDIATIDMDAIQNPNNFYSFDRQRARDAIAYRKALKKELNEISDNISRMGSLARKSN